MSIDGWLKEAKKQIAALDAELILLFGLREVLPSGVDRSYLVAHGDIGISQKNWRELDEMLGRRATGEPLAYIIGEKEFYGRKFRVRPGVLIPRPETESLIDLIKELPLPKQPRFLEVGTGSGCIAITLALEYPQSYVLASDISVTALDIASENDCIHEGRIELIESNLLRDIEFASEEAQGPEHFDVLVANLPYVDKNWEFLDTEALAFEPTRALYAGQGGLALYKRLFQELAERRWREVNVDYVVVEADPCQHERLAYIGEIYGFVCRRIQGYALGFVNANLR